jgi:hypothetical protein
MSLRDELPPPGKNGGECSVKTFVQSKPCAETHANHKACASGPEDWIEIVDDKGLQHSQVYRLMKLHGFSMTDNPVTRHRNGACSCGRA